MLSAQYLWAIAARWAFSQIDTSRSERTSKPLTGKDATTVDPGSFWSVSTGYPASRINWTIGSVLWNRRRRMYHPDVVGQWTPAVVPAISEVVPAGLTVVILMELRTPSHSEYLVSMAFR